MKSISAKEVQQLVVANEQVTILDVRSPEEVASGHIKGMINIPLPLIEFKMNELDKNESYVVVCHAGGRSSQATMFLQGYGYDVTNMDGGMLAWEGSVEVE